MEYDLFDFLTDYKNNDISKEKALDLITKLFVEQSPVFNKLYKALGWQGGTIQEPQTPMRAFLRLHITLNV